MSPSDTKHELQITRKRGAKTIRVRVAPDGQILITAPYFVPKRRIESFVAMNESWILDRQAMHRSGNTLLSDQLAPGINIIHTHSQTIRARAQNSTLKIEHPADADLVQLYKAARPQIISLLRKQAVARLEPEFSNLSKEHNLPYASVRWRFMKSRWGSCTSTNIITLNTQLLRLSQEQYRYVMIHELTHTKHHHHQPVFWAEVAARLPSYKQLRSQMRTIQLWR